MPQDRILLIDFRSRNSLLLLLQEILESCPSFRVEVFSSSPGALLADELDLIHSESRVYAPDEILAILDSDATARNRQIVASLRGASLRVPLLVVMEAAQPDEMLHLLEYGVADFIVPPPRKVDLLTRVRRFLRSHDSESQLARRVKAKLGLRNLIGQSRAFLSVVEKLPLVAQCDVTVLLWGETGTGKELCARAIHYLSKRSSGPFVPVNCGAIPVELIENELFGHERAAFTGAAAAAPGLIREAQGGTLFLDEIDCLSTNAQVKLHRFLQEKEYRPLGSTKSLHANVRIVSATNLDPKTALRRGKLRDDLYYRLNTISLELPPLRARREDIPLLARHFLGKYAAEFEKPVIGLSHDARQALALHDWPGNVRELEHVITRAVVLCGHEVVRSDDIDLPFSSAPGEAESFRQAKARTVAAFEQTYIKSLLIAHHGNISRAARAAKKNRRAFWELIRKHHIDVEEFRRPRVP